MNELEKKIANDEQRLEKLIQALKKTEDDNGHPFEYRLHECVNGTWREKV